MALISHYVKDRWVVLILGPNNGVTETPTSVEGKTGVHSGELPVNRGRYADRPSADS